MDQVRIRANVSAGNLRKGEEVTVAATPMVEGAINSGVYQELERFQSALVEEIAPPPEETPVPPIEVVELPEPTEDIPEKQRGRGRG